VRNTVDDSEILHRLRLVVYPVIYRVSYISGVGILPSTLPLIPFCSAWWFITLFCRVFSFVQSGEEFLVVSNISLFHHLLK